MGHRVETKCLECDEKFEVDHGGGFLFHLLRCDKCGITKSIRFDELGGFLMVPSGRHCVETKVGKCECGGNFTFDAPSRCPKCHSTKIEEGETTVFYD